MNYTINAQIEIEISQERKVIYTISKKHRGRLPQKDKGKGAKPQISKWIIKPQQEVSLFESALKYGYEDKEKHNAWNILLDTNSVICVVGYSYEREELKIAKFVDSDQKDWWHGYPAHYVKNIQDIPPMSILLAWQKAGYISTATMKRIKGGQPCNL